MLEKNTINSEYPEKKIMLRSNDLENLPFRKIRQWIRTMDDGNRISITNKRQKNAYYRSL